MMPDFSPWGEIDEVVFLVPGVDLVSTPSHGGARVTPEAARLLSPEARKCAVRDGGFLWFEEDCCEPMVLRELMDKKLWTPPPDRIKDPAEYEAAINRVIQTYCPDYWTARERRLSRPPVNNRPKKKSR